ncbi:MAG TPA: pilus assembly protein TadE [Propionibacteriaceae bacterium]|nr:pilus assembly protein TadE [Propionibacteriaceae bacterium]
MSGRERDQRGLSVTTMVATMMPAFVVVCGLAVDGAAQASAARHASVVAGQAARTGEDASAATRLAGASGAEEALVAARRALAVRDVDGRVSLEQGRLHVRVDETVDTVFLGVIGVRHLHAHADAWAQLTSG